MHDPDRLIEAYLDQELDQAGQHALRDWLGASEENRRRFALASILHYGLGHSLHQVTMEQEMDGLGFIGGSGPKGFNEALRSLAPGEEEVGPVDITEKMLAEVAAARLEAQQRQQGPAPVPEGPRVIVIPRALVYGLAAAACLAIAVLAYQFLPERPSGPGTAEQALPQPRVIAEVVSGLGARWAAPDQQSSAKSPVRAGDAELIGGLVQLRMNSGALVTLQAPAKVVFHSDDRIELLSGRLHARSEEGAFYVDTAEGLVTDLGTTFGVAVGEDGGLETHVFDGLVQITLSGATAGAKPVALGRGQAARVEDREVTRQPAEPLSFVSDDEFEVRTLAAHGDPEAQRLQDAYELARGSDLLLYVSPTLAKASGSPPSHNLARGPDAIPAAPAAVLGDIDLPARYQGRDALVFNQDADELFFDLPDRLPRVTLSAWINLEHDPEPATSDSFRAILMARGRTLSNVHWQLACLTPDVWQVRLGVLTATGDFAANDDDVWIDHDSPTGSNRYLQTWAHLTTTIDGPTRTVKTYLNGDLVTETSTLAFDHVALGRVCVGSWNTTGQSLDQQVPRLMRGGLSDLMVFDVTLSPQQVKELYARTSR